MNWALVSGVLPIVLIVALGYVLAKSRTIARTDWGAIETLSFRVLIPAMLILTISRTDFGGASIGMFAMALLGGWAITALGALALRLLPQQRLSNASFGTLFQVATRWNAFVVIAAAEQFTGEAALALLAVAIGTLIPTINITCIILLTAVGPNRTSGRAIALAVAKNPLVQACAVGIALYLTALPLPAPVAEALDLIGRAALAVGLLAVGAGISLRRLARWDWKVGLAMLMRPLLAPLGFLLCAGVLGLGQEQTLIGVLVFAAPAATNGYIVARQMGGDADLYADVLTWQTLVALAVLPMWLWLVPLSGG